MKRTLTTLLLATALAGSAFAQSAPVGGPAAKENAAIKAPHTINDGSAKPGANSFTQGEAMQHIQNSGFTNVSGLTKGGDGVWRGAAMKNGARVNVAMDFKGNVTEGMSPTGRMPMRRTMAPRTEAAPTDMAPTTTSAMTSGMRHHHHWRHRHHWRHHHHWGHHHYMGAGVGMSGVDRNKNGVSDKEDRAMAPH